MRGAAPIPSASGVLTTLIFTFNSMENILNQAYAALEKDPVLLPLLKTIPLRSPQINDDVYFVLLKSIVEQQLSLKAAATIWNRFLDHLQSYPHPELILAQPPESLRAVGLSHQKINYLKNIAHFAMEQPLQAEQLNQKSNDELLSLLTQIKGVGRWTAEMILMFSLGRHDVFPVHDLVIRNTMVQLYGLTEEKAALIKALESISERWRPYRSFGCYLLWDWKDNP